MCICFINSHSSIQFVDMMARKLKEAVKACMWKTARYVLRFFSDLVNCHVISTNSLLQLLHTFLDTARDDNSPQGNVTLHWLYLFIFFYYYRFSLSFSLLLFFSLLSLLTYFLSSILVLLPSFLPFLSFPFLLSSPPPLTSSPDTIP